MSGVPGTAELAAQFRDVGGAIQVQGQPPVAGRDGQTGRNLPALTPPVEQVRKASGVGAGWAEITRVDPPWASDSTTLPDRTLRQTREAGGRTPGEAGELTPAVPADLGQESGEARWPRRSSACGPAVTTTS